MLWPLIPVGLLLLAQLVGWVTMGPSFHTSWVLWSTLLTLALIVLRLGLIRYGTRLVGSSAMNVGFGVHSLLLLAATAINPFFAIYSFVGYFDAPRWFRGRWIVTVTVVTGLLCAFGQAGGLAGVGDEPWILLPLIAVNLVASQAVLRLDRVREVEVRKREQVAEELAAAHRGNLRLHQRLLDQAKETGVSQERARLSREIHDTVAQGLVAVIRQLEAIPETDLGGNARKRVERAETSAHSCLDEARRAVAALAPRQLQSKELADAVKDELEVWSERTGLRTELAVDGEPGPPGEHDHVVLRVVQESLSNAAKHAGDCQVTVSLSWTPQMIMVDVCDDGVGFNHEQVERTSDGRQHGLAGMATRVAEVEGRWSVESRPGEGCTVSAVVPR